MKAIKLHVTGIVQGVGFRPYVYRLAETFKLKGWVLNASDGVHIVVEGPDGMVSRFTTALEAHPPAAARIEQVTVEPVEPEGFGEFEIRHSEPDANLRTFVSPDLATCQHCLTELFDENDRRYRYPFINCTDCGPRFTIIEGTPYDRPLTTMKDFPMCEDCAAEYADPGNRRFHAQPDACFVCGPRLYLNPGAGKDEFDANWIWMPEKETRPRPHRDQKEEFARSNSIILEAIEALHSERILGLKGIGGFQLVCNARSETAVSLLRERKHRWGKPLALMFPNIELAERYCVINDQERELLLSPAHPIVLLERREGVDTDDLASSIAPGLSELGVMLPYSPLHHLLMDEFYAPVVMTSGNLSEEPIITDNAEALKKLSEVADLFLLHDRPIYARYDDSVVRVVAGRTQMIRRARGYAPAPLSLGFSSQQEILGAGPEQKNTFTLLSENDAFVSQHIGDLENLETLEAYEDTISLYERLFKIQPRAFAYDLHPEYLASKWAQVQAEEVAGTAHEIKLVGVQHHHAHIVAACAEHNIYEGVIGIAFDGTGYGDDKTIWGGEVLISTWQDYVRFAHLAPFKLPGGAGAIKRPIRIALGLLQQYGLLEHPGAIELRSRLEEHEEATTLAMLKNNLNCPTTTSMGRLFDAVAALLGVADNASFEGSPALLLEAAAGRDLHARPTPRQYRFSFDGEAIDPAPVFEALLNDCVTMKENPDALLSTGELARRFHEAVVNMIGDIATKAARETELSTVVLSGGCFMNRLLIIGAREVLEAKGLRVITNEQLPVNDGCISFGQAAVAYAQLHAPKLGVSLDEKGRL